MPCNQQQEVEDQLGKQRMAEIDGSGRRRKRMRRDRGKTRRRRRRWRHRTRKRKRRRRRRRRRKRNVQRGFDEMGAATSPVSQHGDELEEEHCQEQWGNVVGGDELSNLSHTRCTSLHLYQQ